MDCPQEVAFGYDDDGLLTSAGGLDIHRRTDNGLVDSTTVGAVTSSQDYDAHGGLANLRYTYDGGTVLFQQSLARDGLGRIVTIAENAFGTSQTLGYRYDLAGRLYGVTVDGDTVARYFYDGNGNRTAWDGGTPSPADTASYDLQDRLVWWKEVGYVHDDAGDLSQRIVGSAVTRYHYDALGNLNAVGLASGDSVSYAVDGTNRRIGRKVNGAWTGGWVYRNGLNMAAEVDSSGAIVNRYVYGADSQTPALVIRSGTTYRVVADHLGSVRGVVNTSTGAVAQRRDYSAWGEVESESGADIQALGYAGGLGDTLTGLVRFGARDYQTAVGRWAAKDPVPFFGGYNLYSYSEGDPVNRIDPSGLKSYVYRCQETRGILAAIREDSSTPLGLLYAFWNHANPGFFDYDKNEPGALFELQVGARPMTAGQFGNFVAGYASYYAGRGLGLALVIAGGYYFDMNYHAQSGSAFDDDAESQADIHAGYEYARRENLYGTVCDCP